MFLDVKRKIFQLLAVNTATAFQHLEHSMTKKGALSLRNK